jgi:hypothetical protein
VTVALTMLCTQACTAVGAVIGAAVPRYIRTDDARPGAQVEVVRRGGDSVEGILLTRSASDVTENVFRVSTDRTDVVIPKDDVDHVNRYTGTYASRGALIGLGIDVAIVVVAFLVDMASTPVSFTGAR